jgi:hypothetical protein
MILQKLEVSLQTYGEHKGQYRGAAKFANEHGETTVILLPEHCDAIFNLCADAIIKRSSEVANAMVAPILTQRALEKNELPPKGVLKS